MLLHLHLAVLVVAARAQESFGYQQGANVPLPLQDSAGEAGGAGGAGGKRVALMLVGNLRGFADSPSDENWRTSYEHLYSVITAAGDHVVSIMCCDPDEPTVPAQALKKLNIQVVRR